MFGPYERKMEEEKLYYIQKKNKILRLSSKLINKQVKFSENYQK